MGQNAIRYLNELLIKILKNKDKNENENKNIDKEKRQ